MVLLQLHPSTTTLGSKIKRRWLHSQNVGDKICQNSSVPQGVMGPGYTQKLHHVQESYQLREKWRSEHDLGLEHLPLKYHEFLICHA